MKEGFVVLNIANLSLSLSDEKLDEKPEIEVMIALGKC